MATDMRISVPAELQQAVEAAAKAEGKTVDEVTVEALQKHLAGRTLERFMRQGEARRLGMTDDDVERVVDRAIRESRNESPGR